MPATVLFDVLGDLIHTGKVRDTFAIPGHPDLLLVYASDRVSTHNVVHQSTIQCKGAILTALTIHWCGLLNHHLGLPHHLVAYGQDIRHYLPEAGNSILDDLLRQCLVVKKLTMVPYELIFRRYLIGSLWDKFQSKGLPNPYTGDFIRGNVGLMSRFDELFFSPTDKSDDDDPVAQTIVLEHHPDAVNLVVHAYTWAENYLAHLGITLIDSKFEVGVNEYGAPVLADEILTPDSSRFTWSKDVETGKEPPWLDKQSLRDAAKEQWKEAGIQMPGKTDGLVFEPKVLLQAEARYHQVFRIITGTRLDDYWLNLDSGQKPWAK